MGRRGLAVLVGAASGAAICLVLLLAGCGWVVYNRGKSRRNTTSPMCSVYDEALVNPRHRDTDQWLSPQGKLNFLSNLWLFLYIIIFYMLFYSFNR
jgi:Ca2+/Na+ antiporter